MSKNTNTMEREVEIGKWKSDIMNEMQNITIENIRFDQRLQENYYVCNYIFHHTKLDKLLLGKTILNGSNSFVVSCLDKSKRDMIQPHDVFIRSGSFVKLIKTYVFNNNGDCTHQGLLHKRYTECNTYAKALQLGVKIRYNDATKRNVHYIRLKDSLEVVYNELGKLANPEQSLISSNAGFVCCGTNDEVDEYEGDDDIETSSITESMTARSNSSSSSNGSKTVKIAPISAVPLPPPMLSLPTALSVSAFAFCDTANTGDNAYTDKQLSQMSPCMQNILTTTQNEGVINELKEELGTIENDVDEIMNAIGFF